MTADSRQQRRKAARDRLKAGQRFMAKGLPTEPRRHEVAAIAEVLKDKLLEAGNDRRASQAAELAHALAERSLRTFPARIEIACGRGCNYCCHSFVAVLPAEAFRIADAVRAGQAGRARPVGQAGQGPQAGPLDSATVRERAALLYGLSPNDRIGAKLACPLLVDGTCSVYAMRPLVCRQATSLSLPDCIEEFEGTDRGGNIEISSTHIAHASNAHVALLGALKAVGLSNEAFELGSIMEVVLAHADAEKRWLAGEDLFAGLPRTFKRPAKIELVADGLAEDVAP